MFKFNACISHFQANWLRVALLALVLSLFVAGTVLAAEKTVVKGSLSDVHVKSLSGSVELTGWDKDTIRVEWDQTNPKYDPGLIQQEGRLLISSAREERRGLATDVRIWMPKTMKLVVDSISGDLRVTQMQKPCRLTSVSGEVEVFQLAAGVGIKTVSGDIELKEVAGDVSIQTVSGDVLGTRLDSALVESKSVSGDLVLVLDKQINKIRLTSHSGDIQLTGSLMAEGDLKIKTFSGDIRIDVGDSGFDLEAKTRSGSVVVDQKLHSSESSANRVSGRSKSGGAHLYLSSFSGDIRVKK